jgi:cytochrome c oxidase cbb3-type subunit 3
MKSKRIALGVALALIVVYVAGAIVTSAGAPQQGRKRRAAVLKKGKAIYATNCARCHGEDGRGQTSLGRMVEAPDMTDPAWRKKRSVARMTASVSKGRGGMPAFDWQLTREEIAAAVAYVRAFRK